MILMRENSLQGPLKGAGSEYRDFLGQMATSDFQGSPLSMTLVMDLPTSKSLRHAPYKQQVCTLKVILSLTPKILSPVPILPATVRQLISHSPILIVLLSTYPR
jgi:hypothetical protein